MSVPSDSTQLGAIGFRISATESGGADWTTIDETWALAGELSVFDAGWTSDHLSDAGRERGGGSYESLTMIAALSRRVPGKWVGIAVIANTFRHPAIVAKAATALDNMTGGRFILGLGAGWHAGEHEAFGIPLPPLAERFARFESAVTVISALLSEQARHPPGVTIEDPYYPLRQATNEPPPVALSGPPIWLGTQKRRGIALSARYAHGWPLPGNRAGDVSYFANRRDHIRAALDSAGRDPDAFTFAAQIDCGARPDTRSAALRSGLALLRAGANHLILGVPGPTAPDALVLAAAEVGEPLRDAYQKSRDWRRRA